MKKLNIVLFALLFVLSIFSHASDESLEEVKTRGVTQKFVLTMPSSKPVASVVLLAGGHGKLNLSSFFGSVSFGWGKQNNLVRTRELYANNGFIVATLDAPSDKKKMNVIWRMSENHSDDINAVVKYLKEKADVPVWIIGTSRGTFSAANAGINLNDSIDGLVLTSSITQSNQKWKIYDDYPNGVINMYLNRVTKPVLIVSHKDDECYLTPAKDIDYLANQFTSSSKVKKELVEGGSSPKASPCDALTPHGFLGIEESVVNKISNFIKAN